MIGYADIVGELKTVSDAFLSIKTFIHGHSQDIAPGNVEYPIIFVDLGQSEGSVYELNSAHLPAKMRYNMHISVLDVNSESDQQTTNSQQFRENVEELLFQFLAEICRRSGVPGEDSRGDLVVPSGNVNVDIDLNELSTTYFEGRNADKAYEVKAIVPMYAIDRDGTNCTGGTFNYFT